MYILAASSIYFHISVIFISRSINIISPLFHSSLYHSLWYHWVSKAISAHLRNECQCFALGPRGAQKVKQTNSVPNVFPDSSCFAIEICVMPNWGVFKCHSWYELLRNKNIPNVLPDMSSKKFLGFSEFKG